MAYKPQAYNDGTLKIYKTKDTSEDGDTPVEKLVYQEPLRYEEQTLGVTRYFSAMQNGKKVSTVVRCPRRSNLSTTGKDILVAVLKDGYQYNIELIQWPKEVIPLSMDLTLVRVVTNYVIE